MPISYLNFFEEVKYKNILKDHYNKVVIDQFDSMFIFQACQRNQYQIVRKHSNETQKYLNMMQSEIYNKIKIIQYLPSRVYCHEQDVSYQISNEKEISNSPIKCFNRLILKQIQAKKEYVLNNILNNSSRNNKSKNNHYYS
ncbi:hypothetical protein ABPG74_019768 [Tetrahymena malaccensis]